MLIIRRHCGQSICVGDGVAIEVLECGPNRVKLGISAPKEVQVIRGETRLTRQQNLAAAEIPAKALGELQKHLRADPGEPASTLVPGADAARAISPGSLGGEI